MKRNREDGASMWHEQLAMWNVFEVLHPDVMDRVGQEEIRIRIHTMFIIMQQ